jgi:hypothetical protein
MSKTTVGDFNNQLVLAHKAIPLALELANSLIGSDITTACPLFKHPNL